MSHLTLGFSPCPNDTFIFHALVHGLIPAGGLLFRERLEDVESLNRLVLDRTLDMSKISFHLLGHIREEYALLRSGGALGRGCGPLVVARHPLDPHELRGKRIAIPGQYTTASLLLRLFDPSLESFVIMPFHRIMEAVTRGEVDAGVIIHESRFTYREQGLHSILDLGEWWERETGQPIPLGGIVARRDLGTELLLTVEIALRESVLFAQAHPQAAREYIRAHSQEMSDQVCDAHINLYVNRHSVNLGDDGEAAVTTLLARAESAGIIPRSLRSPFIG
jgi:1,4-dihydroxy-6-naphthoate synthase